MVFDIGDGAEQALLFAAPQGDADGTVQLHIKRFQDAHRLDGHTRSGAVIGRAGAAVPAIEVPADHHHLVFLAAAFDLADDVE